MARIRRQDRRPGCDRVGGGERVQLQKPSPGLFDADKLNMYGPSTTRSCTCRLADDIHGVQHLKIRLPVDLRRGARPASHRQPIWRRLVRREASPRPPRWVAGLVGAVYCRERCVKQRINTRCSSLSTYGHWRSDPTHENRAHMSSVHVVGPGVPRGGRGDASHRTRRRQVGWRWLAGRAPRRRPTDQRIFGCCTPWMSSAGRQVQLLLVDGPYMSR